MHSITNRRARGLFTLAILLMVASPNGAANAANNTVASRELGQPNFVLHSANTVDPDVMFNPSAVAIDRGITPNRAYVVDTGNSRILVYSSVSALVSGGLATSVLGQVNLFQSGCNSSPISASTLCNPTGAVVDPAGNLYVADSGNNRVLVYGRAAAAVNGGAALKVLGQGGNFSSNACNMGGSAPNAESLCNPVGLAVDASANLYLADTNNSRVLEFNTPLTASATPGSGDATADLEFGQGAGSGTDFTENTCDFGGVNTNTLCSPNDVAVDGSGNVYIADTSNHRVLEYNTPLTTNTTADLVFGQSGSFASNTCNLSGVNATGLCNPVGVMADPGGNLYVADFSNNRVLEYNTPRTTDVAADRVFGQNDDFGSNSANFGGSVPAATTLANPRRMSLDSAGNLYLADFSNNRMLEYNAPLTTGTTADLVLGQVDFFHNAVNFVDATGLNVPAAVAIDASVTPNRLYVADFTNNRVLVFANAAAFTNNAAAIAVIGQPDLFSAGCNTGGVVSESTLCSPVGVAVDSAGNLYVADQSNNRVLEYNTPFATTTAGSHDFSADNVFGQGGDFTANGCNFNGSPDADSLCGPSGIALDKNQNLWVADHGNHRVLMYISPKVNTTANVVVGQPDFFSNVCSNGGVSAHSLCNPWGVALDGSGNLFVSDQSNSRVLEFNAPIANNPSASAVFGQFGSFASASCDNSGVSKDSLCLPRGIAVDSHNNLFVADTSNNRTLEYNTPLTTDTHADRVFGQADNFTSNACDFGGSFASAASECLPSGVALDGAFNLFAADTNNNRALEYDPPHFNPATISFGHVGMRRRIRKTVYLVNTQGVWLNNLALSLSGSNDFKIKSTTCSDSLGPQESCRVVITFRPTSRGNESATLNASNDALNSPQSAVASGIGGRRRR